MTNKENQLFDKVLNTGSAYNFLLGYAVFFTSCIPVTL